MPMCVIVGVIVSQMCNVSSDMIGTYKDKFTYETCTPYHRSCEQLMCTNKVSNASGTRSYHASVNKRNETIQMLTEIDF